MRLDAWSGISAFGGMVPLTTCRWQSRFASAPAQELGEFGAPCHNGGSVGLRIGNWYCLLIHTPAQNPTRVIPQKLKLLESAVGMCHGHHFKDREAYDQDKEQLRLGQGLPVDLTLIAACIYQAYPGSYIPYERQRPLRLRGIAVFPVYNPEGALFERLSDHGIASPLGMLVAMQRRVAFPAREDGDSEGGSLVLAISYVACFAGS